MTWTTARTPREDGDDATLNGPGGAPSSDPSSDPGAPSSQTWEPLAPGALGADPTTSDPTTSDPGLFPGLFQELPPPPLSGPLAEALATARTALDEATTATTHLTSLSPHQRLDALRQLAAARHTTDAALNRLTASFTPEDVRALGATTTTDLLITHTGAEAKNAAATVRLATALTAPPAQPPAFNPDPHPDPADPADPADGDDGDSDSDTAADADADATNDAADDLARQGAAGSPAASSSQVALGLLGAAHATGTVSTDVAALALRTLADLPARTRRACMPTADAFLAGVLPGLSHPQAQVVLTTLAHRLDPDRADRGFDPDDLERRYTHLTIHSDGWVDVRARFDPVTGAAVKAALDTASKPAPTTTAPLADPHPDADANAEAEADPDAGEADQLPLDGADAEGGTAGPGDHGSSAGSSTGDGAGGGRGSDTSKGGVRIRDERTAPQRRRPRRPHRHRHPDRPHHRGAPERRWSPRHRHHYHRGPHRRSHRCPRGCRRSSVALRDHQPVPEHRRTAHDRLLGLDPGGAPVV